MTTASKTSKPEAVTFEDFALDIARRREAAGNPELPPTAASAARRASAPSWRPSPRPAPSGSGGEAGRVNLAKELSRRATGQTLYILDEPTTGLHFEDVRKLLEVLHALVEQGNTVVVIEHNLEVIKTADWVIDLGPEGGEKGGEIVAEGTPEDVAQVARSYTGGYLAPLLAKQVQAAASEQTDKARRLRSARERQNAE